MYDFTKRIKIVILLLQLLFAAQYADATTYYSHTSGGNWNDPNAWSTVGYGNATNGTSSYPKSGDVANIGDGYTIYLNLNLTVTTVNVGQGSSGILEFSSAGAYTMNILQSLTINSGAKVWYNGNASRTHLLYIGTNLTNNGTLDLYQDADDVVNLTFNKSTNSIVSGSGTYDLNTVTLNKLTSTTFYLDEQSSGFESAIRDLVLTYGTYNHDNTGTFDVNPSAGSGFLINQDVILKVSQGTMLLSSSLDEVTLQGTIIMIGGTLSIGSSAGLGGLHYDKNISFIPRLDIQGGTLNIYGSLTYKTGNASDPLNFTMSSGTLNLNTGSTGSPDPLFKINDVTGSVFSMTDGSIIFQKPNTTGNTISDFAVCPSSGTVSVGGGLLQFGNTSTANGAAFSFTPITGITLPNIKVTGNNSNAISLAPSQNSTATIQCISLYIDINTTFDIRSISGTTGDNRSLILTGNMDGINSFYTDGTFTQRNSTLFLEGQEGQQIDGNASLTLYNLTVFNDYGGLLAMNINISGTLSMSDGVLYCTSSSQITLLAGASTSLGSSISYIDGPISSVVASSGTSTINFPIGKDGIYRPVSMQVTHTNSASVNYQAEVFNIAPDGFNYTLPGTIDLVSKVRYFSVNRQAVANFSSGYITLSYDADDGVSDYTNLSVANDDGATSWIDLNGSATGDVTGSVTSGYFSSVNSKFTIANKSGGTNPLPVKLVSFDVKQNKNSVLLNWITASEKNSDYFEVQKSSDGINFQNLSKISSAGNSTQEHQYKFTDPDLPNPISYYRLKQFDLDGTFAFSKVEEVHQSVEMNAVIYPNPVTQNKFNLLVPAGVNLSVIKLVDLSGKEISITKSVNENGTITVSTRSLLQGIYFVVINNADLQWQQPIVINSTEE